MNCSCSHLETKNTQFHLEVSNFVHICTYITRTFTYFHNPVICGFNLAVMFAFVFLLFMPIAVRPFLRETSIPIYRGLFVIYIFTCFYGSVISLLI